MLASISSRTTSPQIDSRDRPTGHSLSMSCRRPGRSRLPGRPPCACPGPRRASFESHYPLECSRLRLPPAFVRPLLDDKHVLTKMLPQLRRVLGRRPFGEHRHVHAPREVLKDRVFLDVVWCRLVLRVISLDLDPLGVDSPPQSSRTGSLTRCGTATPPGSWRVGPTSGGCNGSWARDDRADQRHLRASRVGPAAPTAGS